MRAIDYLCQNLDPGHHRVDEIENGPTEPKHNQGTRPISCLSKQKCFSACVARADVPLPSSFLPGPESGVVERRPLRTGKKGEEDAREEALGDGGGTQGKELAQSHKLDWDSLRQSK